MLNPKKLKKQKQLQNNAFKVFVEKKGIQKEKFYNQLQKQFITQLDQVFKKQTCISSFQQPLQVQVQGMVFSRIISGKIDFLLLGIQNCEYVLIHYQKEAQNIRQGKIFKLSISSTNYKLYFSNSLAFQQCQTLFAVGSKEIKFFQIKLMLNLAISQIKQMYCYKRQIEKYSEVLILHNKIILKHEHFYRKYDYSCQNQGVVIVQSTNIQQIFNVPLQQDVTCYFFSQKQIAIGIKNGTVRLFKQNQDQQMAYSKTIYQSNTFIKQIIFLKQDVLVAVTQNTIGSFLSFWDLIYDFQFYKVQITGYISCLFNNYDVFVYSPHQIFSAQFYSQRNRRQQLTLQHPHIILALLQYSSQSDLKLSIVDENGDIYSDKEIKNKKQPPLKIKKSVECTMSQDNNLVLLCQKKNQIRQIVITLKDRNRQVKDIVTWQMPKNKYFYLVKRGYCLISVNQKNKYLDVACYNKRIYTNTSEVCYIEGDSLLNLKFQGGLDSQLRRCVFSKKKKCLYFYTQYNQVYEWTQAEQPKMIGKYDNIKFIELKDDQTVLLIGLEGGSKAYDFITGEEFDLHFGRKTCFEAQLIGDLLLLISKDYQSDEFVYQVTDLNWNKTVFSQKNDIYIKCYVSPKTNCVLSHSRSNVKYKKILPNSKSTMGNFFRFSELVNIKAIAEGYCNKKQAQRLLSKEKGSLLYYFNTAVLFAQDQVFSVLIKAHLTFQKDGLILKNMDPIQYAMRSGFKKIGEKLLKKCSFKGVYTSFNVKGGQGEAMSQLLAGYFREVPAKDLPPYGSIKDGIQPMYSPSLYSYRIRLDELESDFNPSQESAAIRLVQLNKPIDLARGNSQLLDLLRCYRDYGDEKVMNSDAALLANYLENRHFLLEVCETVLRLLILSVNIAAIFTQESILYKIGLAGILLTAVFQLLSLNEVAYFFYYLNILDLLVLVFVVIHNALSLRGEREILFTFFALALMQLRLLFCLKIIKPIHFFFKVLVNVVIQIIPFSFVLAVCIVFFAINGYLVPIDPENPNVGAEVLDSLLGTFFGSSQTEYLANLAPANKFVKWFVLYSRQFWLSVFMLNGILVGIVSGVYEEGELMKEHITFREKIILSLKYESIFARLKAITKMGLTPKYLHAFVTTKKLISKKSEIVACKEEIVNGFTEGQKLSNKLFYQLKNTRKSKIMSDDDQNQDAGFNNDIDYCGYNQQVQNDTERDSEYNIQNDKCYEQEEVVIQDKQQKYYDKEENQNQEK